jgi:photosystem II stability/assembly factor-like uncharacterized protein
VALVSVDGGRSWTQHPMPARAFSVACATRSDCVAVGYGKGGSYAMLSTDGGFAWRREPLPVPLVDLVSCAGGGCVAAAGTYGGAGGPTGAAVLESPNGGRTWRDVTPRGVAGTVTGVSCASPRFCLAVGETAGARPDFAFPVLLLAGSA